MSSPRVLVQILVVGAQILGKAFAEAGRQAVKNAKYRPAGVASDAAGVGRATSGSITDTLTREHRMTLDEAHMILNVKPETPMEAVLKNYEHLFKANSVPKPPQSNATTPTGGRGARFTGTNSHYLQSKVVRARERIEAERKVAEEGPQESATAPSGESAPPSGTQPSGGSGPSSGTGSP
ncbi:hypothetical protein BOTBODRAFT_26203 [Botryobasidium botryosum FD-172 SS1]|uniref:Mitochondrial import inner membrane translocase subunit TIM16 n=1 Tax=Botryobasidium botryosum (strain FD-172 SS1) TaxID=930990 RepID=A0A067NCE6_BOTB1|nr:hypothetical protein BOTBODRAFT_26203 [Botryobasidium botryosum FD-172 SS1]